MNRNFRRVISSLLILTFMFSSVGVGYAQDKNALVLEKSSAQLQLSDKISFHPATTEEINAKSTRGWDFIGYYYADDIFANDAQDIMILAIGLASSRVGLGLYSALTTTAAGLYRRHHNNANNIAAYYKREMYRSTDNPLYWRDRITYYFNASHTLQAGPPVIGNEYEMMDKNN